MSGYTHGIRKKTARTMPQPNIWHYEISSDGRYFVVFEENVERFHFKSEKEAASKVRKMETSDQAHA
jgi:hypothetical protein